VFALIALICFAVAFVLKLVGTTLGDVDLVILGLAFLAAHFVPFGGFAFTRRN
jgi:hypothetical protein